MKDVFYHTITLIVLIVILVTCTDEALFDPTGDTSVTCYAFLLDSLPDSTITISDTSALRTIDTIHTADTILFAGIVYPPDGKLKSTTWDFGDNQTSSKKIVKYTYSKAGIYTAVFSIEDPGEFSMSDTVVVHVNTPPDSVKIISPVDSAVNQSLTPILSWLGYDNDIYDSSLHYTVILSHENNVSDTVVASLLVTQYAFTTSLPEGYAVSWWVIAQDRYGDSKLSDTCIFNTLAPDGDIAGYACRTGLVNTKNNGGISVVAYSSGSETGRTQTADSGYFFLEELKGEITLLFSDSTFFKPETVSVQIVNGIINTIDTVFLQDIFPPLITIVPYDTTIKSGTSLNISFSATDTFYTVDSIFADFGGGYVKTTNTDSTVMFDSSGDYTLRFKAYDPHGNTGIDSVKIHVNYPPNLLTLVQPINMVEVSKNSNPAFTWNASDPDNTSNLKYTIYIGNSAILTETDIQNFDISTTSYTSWNTGPDIGKRYWKLISYDGYDTLESHVDSFKIVDFTNIEGKGAGYALLEGVRKHNGINVNLKIQGGGTTEYSLLTDNQGYYYLDKAFPGDYILTVSDTIRKGFQNASKAVTVIIRDSVFFDTLILEDTTSPVINCTFPANNGDTLSNLLDRNPIFAGTFIEKGSQIVHDSVLIELNKEEIINATITLNSWSFNYPEIADGHYEIIVNAQDSVGNHATPFSRTFCVNSKTIDATVDIPRVSINDSMEFTVNMGNVKPDIKEYRWNFYDNSTIISFDTTFTNSTSASIKWTSSDSIAQGIMIIEAIDDSNMTVYDTVTYSVVQDKPAVNLGNDTTVSIYDTIRIKGVVINEFGTVTMSWSIGGNSFIPTIKTDTSFTAPAIEDLNYLCILKVEDDDGNIVFDTLITRVEKDPSIASISAPDSSGLDTNLTLSSQSSSPGNFGKIAKYEWSIGAYNTFKETSGNDTLIYISTVETDSFIVVLKVTDDDGNQDLDTAFIVIDGRWEYVGTKGFSESNIWETSISIDGNNIPYAAYGEHIGGGPGDGRKVSVMKYNGTNWEIVGNKGFIDSCSYISLEFDGGNIPYIAYSDRSNGDKATVMKYNGTNWAYVGNIGFSDSAVWDVSLAIDNNNVPYVAYSDGAYVDKATVMKYDGINWAPVGNKGFSDSIAWFESLTLDGNNIPYVAYLDVANGNKATVMKYNGTSWETVGNKGFSDGQSGYISLAINNNNIPYIAYSDNAYGNKATVMKYNGTSWEAVGNKGFSDGSVSWIPLAIDGNNLPYVAYKDNAYGLKATVMKYNGTSWEAVGNEAFTDDQAHWISLAIDGNNIIHIAFRDNSAGGKASVMRYK